MLSKPLALALPSEAQTWLLRTCLLSGERQRQAWTSWLEHVGDPIEFVRTDKEGVKGLLPLLYTVLRDNHIPMDNVLSTCFRTAYLNEELRSTSYEQICRQVLSAFKAREMAVMVVKGADLAYTVYDHPVLRHTDGVDLLIGQDDAESALDVLGSLGCVPPTAPVSRDWRTVACKHGSGLHVVLHSRLFDLPFAALSTDVWACSRVESVAGISTRVLSPVDNLLYTCGRVYYGRADRSPRWVCDAAVLLARYPSFDWRLLLGSASSNRLALPLSLTLGYLTEQVSVPIPRDVLQCLVASARETDMLGYEVALAGARTSRRGGLKRLLRVAGNWRSRLLVLRWVLFPTAAYVRWAEGMRPAWVVPLYYVVRPLRYIARRYWVRESHEGV